MPVGGALSLMVLLWLAVRGIMELAVGFRIRRLRLRVPMLVLGALNHLLAIILYRTVPWSALTLPGYILGFSFFFGAIMSIIGALADRRTTSIYDRRSISGAIAAGIAVGA